MKKLYYNLQLLSSFLLNYKQYLLLIFTAFYISNNIISPAYCEDKINYQMQQSSSSNDAVIGWVLFAGIAFLTVYFNRIGMNHIPAQEVAGNLAEKSSEVLSSLSATAEKAPEVIPTPTNTVPDISFTNSFILEQHHQMLQQKEEIINLKDQIKDMSNQLLERNQYVDELETENIMRTGRTYNVQQSVKKYATQHKDKRLQSFIDNNPDIFEDI
jgi:hypothetical protein